MSRLVPAGSAASPPSDVAAATTVALGLALGRRLTSSAVIDWALVFDVASRELLVPLAWARSAQRIRYEAPPAVADSWRRAALSAHLRAHQQLELLRRATAAFTDAGVEAIVLKGLPLGARLYGDISLRASADIDLYVSVEQRARASLALRQIGWRSVSGHAPWHEAWSRWIGDTEFHLELHSSLVSDHLTHLRVPAPAASLVSVADATVLAHGGSFLSPYLAAHLATHQMPPLLWLVDFATLWNGLAPDDCVAAEAAAGRAGLSRYLSWARERALLVVRAASGDATALGALGIGADRRTDRHSIWRHLGLAANLTDRVRVAAAFAVPRSQRRDMAALMRLTVARLRTRARSLTGAARRYGSTSGDGTGVHGTGIARPLTVERSDMISLAREAVRAGGALRVRVPGGSMLPTIPRGSLVRIAALPTGDVMRGDVLLALTDDGEPVIHRVVTIGNGHVVLRGDAAIHTDPPIPLTRVIGVATHVGDGVIERPLGHRPRQSVGVAVLKLRRQVASVMRRAR